MSFRFDNNGQSEFLLPTKQEAISVSAWYIKVLYYIGVIEIVKIRYTCRDYFSLYIRYRKLHPMTWVLKACYLLLSVLLFVCQSVMNEFNDKWIEHDISNKGLCKKIKKNPLYEATWKQH